MPIVLAVQNGALFTTSDEGQTLQAADPSLRFLHLLPKLLLTGGQALQLGRRKARLRVTSGSAGIVPEPEGGVSVRKAYPNSRYLVGGSTLTRKGWLIPLPKEAGATEVVMTWEVPLEGGEAPHRVRHALTVRFKAMAEAKFSAVYSMDLATWPRAGSPKGWFGDLAPVNFTPYAAIGAHDLQGSRKAWIEDDSTTESANFREVLDMPGQSLGQLFDLQALGQTVEIT